MKDEMETTQESGTMEPALCYRGIVIGIWWNSTLAILLTLVPGIGLSLGNLPGDFDAGAIGNSVDLPLMTITLLSISVAGLYHIIAGALVRREHNRLPADPSQLPSLGDEHAAAHRPSRRAR